MNGNPNAYQKRFHAELREMYKSKFAGAGQLHHILGSRRKIYKYKKAGEWLVILISEDDHHDIAKRGFEWEKFEMTTQIYYYEQFFGKPYPAPAGLTKAFLTMKKKGQVMKGYCQSGDDV